MPIGEMRAPCPGMSIDAPPRTVADRLAVAFFDRSGRRVALERWMELRADPAYRFLRRTAVADGVEVITAWLGTDQGDGLGGEPLTFGTVTYRAATGRFTGERFAATEDQALADHDEQVAREREAAPKVRDGQ